MRKTRKLGIRKRFRQKHKSKRLGRGIDIENKMPFLLKEKLNDVSLRSHNQNFYEPGLVSHILKDIPRASVTAAIKKTAITNELKIAQAALDAYKSASQSIHDHKIKLEKELGDLEDKREKLEKAIGYSKLDKYDDLKDKYDKLVRSESMLKRSSASLIRIRLETQHYGAIGKLNAINAKIEKVNNSYNEAYTDDVKAYDEQDRLTIIVRDLEQQLEDVVTSERMLNRAQGRKRKNNTYKKRRRN